MSSKVFCKTCGAEVSYKNLIVSVYGMYDCHLFTRFEGNTPEEIVQKWRDHNAVKHPAIVGGNHVNDLGPVILCPVHLSAVNPRTNERVTIRSVGDTVFPDQDDTEERVQAWLHAVKSDPLIPKILKENTRCES